MFDLDTQAGVMTVLASVRASQLSAAEKSAIRDLVFLYTNGGRDESVRIELDKKLRAHNIEVVSAQKTAPAPTASDLPFGSSRPVPSFKNPTITPTPTAVKVAEPAVVNPPVVPTQPVYAVPKPPVVSEPVLAPAPVMSNAQAVPPPVATMPVASAPTAPQYPPVAPVAAVPMPPVQPVAPVAPSAPVPSAPASSSSTGYLERIREIKTAVNSQVGNPVNLVDINNEVGREYMNALLEAMKKLSAGAESEMGRAMARLETAYQSVEMALLTHKQNQSLNQNQNQPPVSVPTPVSAPLPPPPPVSPQPPVPPPSPAPSLRPEPPAPAPVPRPMPVPMASSVPVPVIPVAPAPAPVSEFIIPPRPMAPGIQTTNPNQNPDLKSRLEVTTPPVSPAPAQTPTPMPTPMPSPAPTPAPANNMAPLPQVPAFNPPAFVPPPSPVAPVLPPTPVVRQASSLADSERVLTPLDLPDASSLKTAVGGDPLMTREIDDGLDQLLSDWILFKKSGLFARGPKGREHPLFLKIAALPVPLILAGRFEGSTQEIRQSITDYMNGWRYEQGIIYQQGETFERYLRRVISHILDLQKQRTQP